MKIRDIKIITFRTKTWIGADKDGHQHPCNERNSSVSLITILTDEDVIGEYVTAGTYSTPSSKFDPSLMGDTNVTAYIPNSSGDFLHAAINRLKPILIGEDPFCRERIFNKMYKMQRLEGSIAISDKIIAMIDLALWDLAGKFTNLPVYKLLGGHRTKLKAYGSIMVGDHIKGGLDTPEAYGEYSVELVKRGYQGIKLHTWMDEDWNDATITGKPDPKKDIEACRAVRESVGNDIPLMLDAFHNYDRYEALWLGKELEKLNFEWLEEPMDEYNMSSYKWLADNLDIPIIGPESAKGKGYTRAEWITNGACDICRAGIMGVGGLTPFIKIAHLCELFAFPLEMHSGGPGTMHAMAAMMVPGKYIERGLLHPFLEFDTTPPWFKVPIDVMDDDGYVNVPQGSGLGYVFNYDYIKENLIK